MCPPDPQRAHHRQMQWFHLNLACLALRCPPHPFLPPCSAPRVFSPGYPLGLLWPPGAAILALSWFETCFSLRLHCVVLWLA